MTILIGIILIFLGMGIYSKAGIGYKSNDWLCMLGCFLIMTGAIIIGMTMDGKL